MAESGIDWKMWGVEQWNERLLEHFFSNRGDDPPVAVLLVTSDELARVTGDPSATSDEARSSFVDAVKRTVRSKGLLEDASNYQGWPTQPPLSRPKFVAHLVLTCLAASESSEELADENSFIARLRNLVEGPANSLSILPTLWVNLRNWLALHDVSYRRLVLPEPGGLTRIGYSIKLTFPDRRDQQRLSQLLDEAGLAGMVPPVGRVVSVVASERTRFGAAFQLAFDEFRRLFESGRSSESRQLSVHRFWAAVVDASLRGRGHEHAGAHAHYAILAEEADDGLSLFAASDLSAPQPGVVAVTLLARCGRWQFGLVPEGESLEAGGLHAIVSAILAGRVRLPRVSALVDQGILPFALGSHGVLELVERDQLESAVVALVHKEKVADLLKLYPDGVLGSSAYEGWMQLSDPKLRAAPTSVFLGTCLDQTWILHESLSLPTIGFRGGVRTEEGWLGIAEVLPVIVAEESSCVWLEAGEGRVDLQRDAAGLWRLPVRDWDGQFVLNASWNDSESKRTVRFNSTTASESFKAPREPAAWIVEGTCNTSSLNSTLAEEHASTENNAEVGLEDPILLGAGVGEFVSDSALAAWAVTGFGGKFIGRRGDVRGDDALPSYQVDTANARRRWRRLLLKCAPDPSDPEFAVARRRVQGMVGSGSPLPSRSITQVVPELAPRRFEVPKSSVDRLARVLAGRAAARAGLPWREWKELVLAILRIDAKHLGHVTRAWMEGGFIDVASSARWRTRATFPRTPSVLAYRTGGIVNAVVSGLTLPVTQDAIRDTASRLELLVLDRGSVSALVPSVLQLHGHDEDALNSLAQQFRMPIAWLSAAAIARFNCARVPDAPPPTHYEHAGVWRNWSLQGASNPDILVEHFARADRPDYWLATYEGDSFWSYELNPIRAWAAHILGEPLVSAPGSDDLVAHHGYLPLPMARFVNVLGLGLAGPLGTGEYRYPVGAQLRERVLSAILRLREPTVTIQSAARERTCTIR
ncbi:hypothetical protein [Lysobacter sp. Root983]|uniref:hypothetical protein n=1 Tax=Lysobacter sp. Root983 TaxID=1736613 RepID=UPI000AE7640A|nr:hypothetical protein [Lysobacter sp. Root983]